MKRHATFFLAVASELGLSGPAARELEDLLNTFAPQGINADELAGAIHRMTQRRERERTTRLLRPLEDAPGQVLMPWCGTLVGR